MEISVSSSRHQHLERVQVVTPEAITVVSKTQSLDTTTLATQFRATDFESSLFGYSATRMWQKTFQSMSGSRYFLNYKNGGNIRKQLERRYKT